MKQHLSIPDMLEGKPVYTDSGLQVVDIVYDPSMPLHAQVSGRFADNLTDDRYFWYATGKYLENIPDEWDLYMEK